MPTQNASLSYIEAKASKTLKAFAVVATNVAKKFFFNSRNLETESRQINTAIKDIYKHSHTPINIAQV